MACAFTHDIFEMIAMIAEVRTPCWWSDQDAARRLETPTARHWHVDRSLVSSKRGGRGSFTMLPRHNGPTGGPPSALWTNGAHQHAHCRRSREVGQVGRAGLVGIVWRLLRPFRYLIGKPGAGSRTCQAYGVRSNLRPVPSDEGARDLGQNAFQ
jgi:hypothetical protein